MIRLIQMHYSGEKFMPICRMEQTATVAGPQGGWAGVGIGVGIGMATGVALGWFAARVTLGSGTSTPSRHSAAPHPARSGSDKGSDISRQSGSTAGASSGTPTPAEETLITEQLSRNE
jgi:hypothetical protein